MLERAGAEKLAIGPLVKEASEANSRPIINIGIKVGGIAQPSVSVGMQMLSAGRDDAEDAGDIEEGELVGDNDDSDD